MTTRLFRPVPWDIYEEHLEEAAFLWGRWEDALVAANYVLDDVAVGPEARLLAHLDGLVLGGRPVADDLLVPALTDDDAGRSFAASWALVQAEHGADHQGAVIDVLANGAPRARAAVARAMALAPRTELSRVAAVWATARPEVRAALLAVLGSRDLARTRPWIEPSLRSGEPSLMSAALRCLLRSPEPALTRSVEDALDADDVEVRTEAIAAGAALGSQFAWEACRKAAGERGDACRLPLGLLATSTHKQDRATVRASASDSAVKRHAIWALGFAGDVEAADILVEATEDAAVAKIAGESLSAITGLVMGRSLIQAGKTIGPDVCEVGDDDPPPVVRPEDHLLLPNAKAFKKWWQRERKRFPTGVDQVQGRPRTVETVHAALRTATMWRREVLWLELARTTGVPSKVNLKAWSADQRRQWDADAAATSRVR